MSQRATGGPTASAPALPPLSPPSTAEPDAPPPQRRRTMPRRLSSTSHLVQATQEAEDLRRAAHARSPWIRRYEDAARRTLLEQDLGALLGRFEDLTVPARQRRRPHNLTLLAKHPTSAPFAGLDDDEEDEDDGRGDPALVHGGRAVAAEQPTHTGLPGMGVARFRRQATQLILRQRSHGEPPAHARASPSPVVVGAPPTTSGTTTHSATTSTSAKIVPKRFLFDATRWPRSARCDYCLLAGGDLECATCDVVAHAPCFLAAYEAVPKKTRGAFVVPTRFSWLCQHCQTGLQEEYDLGAKRARSQHIANQRSVFGKVVQAYIRMSRDALAFKRKKEAIVKIQAIIRGRLARARFSLLKRMRVKPYAVESLHLRGFQRHPGTLPSMASASTSTPDPGPTAHGMSSGATLGLASEELRLANGFSCNPYVYVTVVDGEDDDNQLFCFETSVRRGVSTLENDLAWGERLFVPGVNGNVTFCFTLLSKNGPNNFVLGQAVLRSKQSEAIWRAGLSVELVLGTELEIFPRTAQRQPLRLADPSAHAHVGRRPLDQDLVFANGSSAALTLAVHIRPYSEVHAYCGYMLTKNTIDSLQTSPRWCVLADGVLRIYRHFGVVLASETVDMARTIEIKLLETRTVHREELWIVMEHINRQYVFQCERKAATRLWLKKLLAATRYGTAGASIGGGNGDLKATATGVMVGPPGTTTEKA